MRIFRSYKRKYPTEQEYKEFKGPKKYQELWFMLDENWKCPVCNRSKKELIRWKKSNRTNNDGYWSCSFHQHHDHGNRWKGTILICGDCNSADGIAKRYLHIPKNWSFSIDELKEFVTCEINGSIENIDLDIAFDIFNEWVQSYGLN